MPDSPHTRVEMRANAPKPSKQSKANWSNGIKTRHMDSSRSIRWGEGYERCPVLPGRILPEGSKKSLTSAQFSEAGLAGKVNTRKTAHLCRRVRSRFDNQMRTDRVEVKNVTGTIPNSSGKTPAT